MTGGSDYASRVVLSLHEAMSLAEGALSRMGFDAEEARVVAAHVVDAEFCGYPALGLQKILSIAEHPRFAAPRSAVRLDSTSDGSATVDGGNHPGMYALHRATQVAIETAQVHGIAVVTTRNFYMGGRLAHYLEVIARGRLVGLQVSSGTRNVLPPGARIPLLGTNPIGIGLPSDGEPLIVDISTAALNASDVSLARRLGNLLPPGAAVDRDGHESRDPAAVQDGGGILPFGGHKGYALALAIQALCMLANPAQDTDSTHLQIVLDPNVLMPADEFRRSLGSFIDAVQRAPRHVGVDAIRMPSQRAFASRSCARAAGCAVERGVCERLASL